MSVPHVADAPNTNSPPSPCPMPAQTFLPKAVSLVLVFSCDVACRWPPSLTPLLASQKITCPSSGILSSFTICTLFQVVTAPRCFPSWILITREHSIFLLRTCPKRIHSRNEALFLSTVMTTSITASDVSVKKAAMLV